MTASATMHPFPDVLSQSSTDCMRPRTRSGTKSKLRPTSKSKLKRAGEDKPKPSRSTKLPRTRPASRPTQPACDVSPEPLYGLLWDVPQSMLSSFQVAPLPSQTCDVENSSPSVFDAALLDIERFASTGPEPMFDHSWRVAFVEARIPMEENRSQFASDQTICADSAAPEEPRGLPHSGSLTFFSSSLTPPVHQYQEPSDEDASPVTLGSDVQLVDTYKRPAHGDTITEHPSHFHPPVHVHPYHSSCPTSQGYAIPPERYGGLPSPNKSPPNSLQEAVGSQLWPPSCAPPFMPSFRPPAHVPAGLPSSLVPFSAGHSLSIASDMGRMPYQQKHSDPLHRELPPVHRFQPASSTLPFENRNCDISTPTYLDFRLPPPPPLTSFPIHPPLPPLGFPEAPLSPDSASRHPSSVTDACVPHPHPFVMQNSALSYPAIQSAMSVPMPPMPLPVLQPTPSAPTPWCALFDDLKKRTQTDAGPAKKKRRTSALTPEEAGQPGSNGAGTGEDGQEERVHPCPLCPRVFPLPNSLALHLKWHWGASGLEWKRGISRNGKGVERAMREAEERGYRAPAAHIEQSLQECSAPICHSNCEVGASASHQPSISAIGGAHGTSPPSPMRNPDGVPSGPFSQLTSDPCQLTSDPVSQTSWNPPYNPYWSSSGTSTSTSELGESPGLPPFDSGGSLPFPRLPSLGELALPQPPTPTVLGAHPFDSEFMIEEGLFHTAAGPDDALQNGTSNHTAWSHNWFGYDDFGDQGESPDVDANGEEDFGDPLGDPQACLEVHTDARANGRGAAQDNREPLSSARPGQLESVR